MILTDREIQISIDHKVIIIDPPPEETAYSSTSLDLTLDQTLTEFKAGAPGINRNIDPTAAGFDHELALKELTSTVEISSAGYEFSPGKLILAWTRERVKLEPHARIAARVEGKSSLARLGIGVHITAPTIHSGFSGRIRLEMMNHGSIPIILKSGMRICQLIFEQTIGTPVRGYKGRFFDQSPNHRAG